MNAAWPMAWMSVWILAWPPAGAGQSPAPSHHQAPTELSHWFDATGTFWETSAEEFMRRHKAVGFRWVSATDQDTARVSDSDASLEFLGQRVWEALVRFEQARPAEAALLLYSRGDAGEKGEMEFLQLVKDVDAALGKWTGVQGGETAETYIASGARAWSQMRVWPPHDVQLDWSATKGSRKRGFDFRAEFVRVRFARHQATATVLPGPSAGRVVKPAAVSAAELRGRVRRADSGDVVLDGVPMVDQGQKGYCAVATAERVFRYYGRDFDQHELAQLASSSSERGTNPDVMVDVLRRAGSKLGCKVRVYEDTDFGAVQQLLERYNRAAKKRGARPVLLPTGQTVYLNQLYDQMDYAVLKEARLRIPTDLKKFRTKIAEYVDQGIPLCWSVMMGKVKETPAAPQAGGGHMRLIVGYNDRSVEVLYSDSWGRGHELKRMAADDAWTITTGLYAIEPLKTTF